MYNYENLDTEELLRLSLEAMNANRDAEAMSMLKLILSRDPQHLHASFLLAAEHAQIGMLDRAEAGMRAVVARSPEFAIARFQLGQMLTMKGAADESRKILSPLLTGEDALSAYARGMAALSAEDADTALREFDSGLTLPQEIPALTADMRRLRDNLAQNTAGAASTDAAPVYLAGYGYGRPGDAE